MRTRFATAGLLALVAAAPVNQGDIALFRLDAVVFDGNARIPTAALQDAAGMAPGDKVDRARIVTAYNAVIAVYDKANVGGQIAPVMTYPRPGHIVVTFKITEAAAPSATLLDHETFTGNETMNSAILAPALTLRPGDTLTTDAIAADLNSLTALYKGASHTVTITPRLSDTGAGHADLNYEIDEHPPRRSKKK